MLKIGSYIRINPLTAAVFFICHILGQGRLFAVSYFTVFCHEAAHLLFARKLGLCTDKLTFEPFGVNLQLKNKIVFDISDEIILYLSGPLFNIISAVLLSFIKADSTVLSYFYTCNTVIFTINIKYKII